MKILSTFGLGGGKGLLSPLQFVLHHEISWLRIRFESLPRVANLTDRCDARGRGYSSQGWSESKHLPCHKLSMMLRYFEFNVVGIS